MGRNTTAIKWAVFGAYLVFSITSYVVCLFILYAFWEARHAKPIAIRMPLLGLINYMVACVALVNGWFGILEQIVGHVVSAQFSIAIAGFWLVFFPVMAMTITWNINWQYSFARVEAEKVWKPELDLQLSKPLVMYLTPIMQSWHGALATALVTTIVLYSVIVIPLIVSATIIRLSTLIALMFVLAGFIALTLIIAYQTSQLGNTYGLRQEFKYLFIGFIVMTVTHVAINNLFKPLSFAFRIALNTRNCCLVTAYIYVTGHLSVKRLKSMQKWKQIKNESSSNNLAHGLNPKNSQSNLFRVTNSVMLRKVFKEYESFVLFTEHCVSEMSVEGILFIVWYMRAKQLLYAFLRDNNMFDYDSAYEQIRLNHSRHNSNHHFNLNISDLTCIKLLQDVLYYDTQANTVGQNHKLSVMNSLRGLNHLSSSANLSLDLTAQLTPIVKKTQLKKKKKKRKKPRGVSSKEMVEDTKSSGVILSVHDQDDTLSKTKKPIRMKQVHSLPVFGPNNSDSIASASRTTYTEDMSSLGDDDEEEEIFSADLSPEQHMLIESPRSTPVRTFGMDAAAASAASDDIQPSTSLGHLLKNLKMQTRSDLLRGDNTDGIRSTVPSPRAGIKPTGFRHSSPVKGPDLLSVNALHSSGMRSQSVLRFKDTTTTGKVRRAKLTKKGGSIDQYTEVTITPHRISSSELRFFSEIGTVVCLPTEIINTKRDMDDQSSKPLNKSKTSEDEIAIELSSDLEKKSDEKDDFGNVKKDEMKDESDEHKKNESEESRMKLKGIIDVLHRLLRDFLSMDGMHSVNVSNDCRVSALKYVSRLNQILDDGRQSESNAGTDTSPSIGLFNKQQHSHQSSGVAGNVGISAFFNYNNSHSSVSPVLSDGQMTVSKKVRIILKCILCLDRVLNEIMRVLKVDSFQRFLETDQFKQWNNEENMNMKGRKDSHTSRNSGIRFTRVTTRSTSSSSSAVVSPAPNDGSNRLPPLISLPKFRKST